jgi:hypothetical protein
MRLISVLGAAVLAVSVPVGPPAGAAAEAPATAQVQAQAQAAGGCVTKREWRRARTRMPRARVHRIFDTNGRFLHGHAGGYSRGYNPCWRTPKTYVVSFSTTGRRDRVAGKGLFRA